MSRAWHISRRSSRRAFSLIELLVVVAVIAILAGLVLQTAGYVQKRGATARAEAEIKALEAALESYKADMGDYPRGNNTAPNTNNSILRQALQPDGVNELNHLGKVYFEFPKGMAPPGIAADTVDAPVVDPFGQGYGYSYPGSPERNGEAFFDLWSLGGGDGADEETWIKNW